MIHRIMSKILLILERSKRYWIFSNLAFCLLARKKYTPCRASHFRASSVVYPGQYKPTTSTRGGLARGQSYLLAINSIKFSAPKLPLC